MTDGIPEAGGTSTGPLARLLSQCLANIGRLNPTLAALVTVDEAGATRTAARLDAGSERGEWGGLLHGVTVTLKDNIDVVGMPTTNGAPAFFDGTATHDAEIVRRLRAAGAVILGKANLHELACGPTTQNPHLGSCRNPWDPERIPGGSSGGSGAAVASGMCIASIGSDTGGSVRLPAALNGVSGLRPTTGRISNRGSVPLSPSLDTLGPIARSVADVARVFAAIAGYDADDPYSVDRPLENFLPTINAGIARMRIGVPRNFFFDRLEPGLGELVSAALRELERCGAKLVEIDVPGVEAAQDHTAFSTVVADAAAIHRARLERAREKFGADVRQRLELGTTITGVRYAEALRWRDEWRVAVRRLFHTVDAVASPTVPITAPRISECREAATSLRDLSRLTYCWAAAGIPAISLPCGFAGNGMPVGLQLAAASFEEPALFRAGIAYQARTDWHLARPKAARG